MPRECVDYYWSYGRKSNLSNKLKWNFIQAAVVSILLYGCTTWTLTKHIAKKLDGNCTRMLQALWNKSWKQHSNKTTIDGHLSPISKTIQIRQTRYVGHNWKSKDEIISDVLLWTPAHERESVGQPKRTYLQQLCVDTGCNPEDLLRAMVDRSEWRERIKEILTNITTWRYIRD